MVRFAIALLTVGILAGRPAFTPAAPFVNLDFESASLPDDVLPGWTTGGTDRGVGYQDVCIGGACLTLQGGLEGRYSLFLQSGYNNDMELTGVSISQVGEVPADAHSIQMLSRLDRGIPDTTQFIGWENLRASVDGQDIPLQLLAVADQAATIGGNLPPSVAGVTVELVIETILPPDSNEYWSNLDAISFSPSLVPEPSGCVFLVAAMASLTIGRSIR